VHKPLTIEAFGQSERPLDVHAAEVSGTLKEADIRR